MATEKEKKTVFSKNKHMLGYLIPTGHPYIYVLNSVCCVYVFVCKKVCV